MTVPIHPAGIVMVTPGLLGESNPNLAAVAYITSAVISITCPIGPFPL